MKGLDLPVLNASDVAGAVSGALGFGEKAGRGLVSGPPQTVAGSLGAASPPGAPALPMTAEGIPQTTAGGVATGAAKVASGMTSARNLSMAALMGPFGKIAPLLTRAVGAGFSLSMLKHVYDQEPAIQDAIAKKDWPRAAEGITEAVGTAGLAAVGAGVGLRRGAAGEPVSEPSPVERATSSVAEGMKALGPASFVPDTEAAPAAPSPPEPEPSQSVPASATGGAAPLQQVGAETAPPSTTGLPTVAAPAAPAPPSFIDEQTAPAMSATVAPLAPEQQAEPEKRAVTPTVEEARVPSNAARLWRRRECESAGGGDHLPGALCGARAGRRAAVAQSVHLHGQPRLRLHQRSRLRPAAE